MLRRILARLQLDGELFLLTFPFIEPQGDQILALVQIQDKA